jgi:hypothetical protein
MVSLGCYLNYDPFGYPFTSPKYWGNVILICPSRIRKCVDSINEMVMTEKIFGRIDAPIEYEDVVNAVLLHELAHACFSINYSNDKLVDDYNVDEETILNMKEGIAQWMTKSVYDNFLLEYPTSNFIEYGSLFQSSPYCFFRNLDLLKQQYEHHTRMKGNDFILSLFMNWKYSPSRKWNDFVKQAENGRFAWTY